LFRIVYLKYVWIVNLSNLIRWQLQTKERIQLQSVLQEMQETYIREIVESSNFYVPNINIHDNHVMGHS